MISDFANSQERSLYVRLGSASSIMADAQTLIAGAKNGFDADNVTG
jgi:hypothetical protein